MLFQAHNLLLKLLDNTVSQATTRVFSYSERSVAQRTVQLDCLRNTSAHLVQPRQRFQSNRHFLETEPILLIVLP
jgi:hypothetical protein